jgi:hypothetical protein
MLLSFNHDCKEMINDLIPYSNTREYIGKIRTDNYIRFAFVGDTKIIKKKQNGLLIYDLVTNKETFFPLLNAKTISFQVSNYFIYAIDGHKITTINTLTETQTHTNSNTDRTCNIERAFGNRYVLQQDSGMFSIFDTLQQKEVCTYQPKHPIRDNWPLLVTPLGKNRFAYQVIRASPTTQFMMQTGICVLDMTTGETIHEFWMDLPPYGVITKVILLDFDHFAFFSHTNSALQGASNMLVSICDFETIKTENIGKGHFLTQCRLDSDRMLLVTKSKTVYEEIVFNWKLMTGEVVEKKICNEETVNVAVSRNGVFVATQQSDSLDIEIFELKNPALAMDTSRCLQMRTSKCFFDVKIQFN